MTCTTFIAIINIGCFASSFDNIVLDITDYIQNDYSVLSCPCYISLCYIKQIILNAEVSVLTKIDLSTWVADSFLMILCIFATRIMSWPVTMGVNIKVIIKR